MNASLLNQMSCIDLYLIEKVYLANYFLYSLRKHKWIEIQLRKGNFNPMFSTTSATKSQNDVYFKSSRGNISAILTAEIIIIQSTKSKPYVY